MLSDDMKNLRAMRRVVPQPPETGTSISPARSALWIPRSGLASCVRAIMSLDTHGVDLEGAQRYNHFPASPVCSVNWYFSGDCALLEPGFPAQSDSPRVPIGRITFNGPFTRPTISWNSGPMHAMVLLLMPDALGQLTGIDPCAWINRVVPVEAVFDAPWLELCRTVDEAGDDEARVRIIESFLLPRWREARPETSQAGRLLADWSRALALRAASSGLGRSQRQFERRIKQWTGQTQRELRGLGRSEQAFFDVVAAHKAGNVNWSEVASNTGFADQSHMCRQTRRVTGFSPEELRRRISTEESFWAYRLWGFSEGLTEE